MRTLLLVSILLFCGCNMQNIEYRKWNEQGQLVENVRMGKGNFLYWFGLKNFSVEAKPIKVDIGELNERNDPNSVEALNKSLDIIKTLTMER